MLRSEKVSTLGAGGWSIRIAHVIASIERPEAGPSYSVRGLASAQAAAGADVSLLSLGSEAPSETAYRDIRFGTDFSFLPVLRRLHFSSAMHDHLLRGRWDVVHNHGLWLMPNLYAAWAAERIGARLVTAPRGMLSAVALGFSPRRKRAFDLLFQRRALERVDMFHATSESEYAEIRAQGLRQPVAIVPNGVALAGPEQIGCGSAAPSTVLSLGRIHPKKGLDQLIRAWARIEAELPGWRLVIRGPDEGGHARDLAVLIRELGLARAEIAPAVFGEEKTRVLASAEIFVLPTRSENFAMTVAESLAAGTPVISTKGAPWSGLDRHGCGWWVDHGVESLASALLAATALTREKRSAMGQNGRLWMERDFSWESVGARMLHAYVWLCGQADRPGYVLLD